jgi:hypothetical protein
MHMYYKPLFCGLLMVVSFLMVIIQQAIATQKELNIISNSNITTNATAATINQTELDEWFNSLPDGTYGRIVDLHTYNSTTDYKGEDYSNSVDENGSLILAQPIV